MTQERRNVSGRRIADWRTQRRNFLLAVYPATEFTFQNAALFVLWTECT